MNDSELSRAISRARRNAIRKAARIKAREQLPNDVMSKINPAEGPNRVQGMPRAERESYLKRLQDFNSRSFDVYKSATGDLISSEQWQRYKESERAVNAFIRRDLKRYEKFKMPLSDMNVLKNFEFNRVARQGFTPDDASGSNMFIMNRLPKQVTNVEALIEANYKMLNPDYKNKKLSLAKDQFRKMMNAVGDIELINNTLDLSDNQFWGLWNYTEFANDASFIYESVKLGMSLQKPSLTDTMAKVHYYAKWASQLKV